MKLEIKKRLMVYGILSSISLIPSLSRADETIPIKFKKGDIISASVINALLDRINKVQKGFTMPEDIDGDWTCSTSSRIKNGDTRCETDGLLFTKEGVLTFNSAEGQWSYSGEGGTDGVESCGMFASSGSYDIKANRLILEGSPFGSSQVNVYPLTRANPTVFRWDGANASIIECAKKTVPPAPANNLVATVAISDVTLSWTDQSDNEVGFKVQRKTLASDSWEEISILSENEVSYLDVGLPNGSYLYRIIATNATGDAMSSSEVQVVIQ